MPMIAPMDTPAIDRAVSMLHQILPCLLDDPNPRLALACLAVAVGLTADNETTMTDIGRRHGISKAGVSKRVVGIRRLLDLPPSRQSMAARRDVIEASSR